MLVCWYSSWDASCHITLLRHPLKCLYVQLMWKETFCRWSEIDRTLLELSSCKRWILQFVLYLCVLCCTTMPPAIPGNQSPHSVSGLLWLKGPLVRYGTIQQSLVTAVNRNCTWSLKINNMESVFLAGKAGAKEPEGCFYILNHQPLFFFFASNIMMNAI